MSEAVEFPTDRSKSGYEVEKAAWDGVNRSGYQALDFKIFVLKDEVRETTTEAGIILTGESVQREKWNVDTGVIVSCGCQAFRTNLVIQKGVNKQPVPVYWEHRPKPGDRIQVRENTGMSFKGKDGKEYFVFTDKDILGVEQ
jgi:co-chaperonin GroES (HSP10)